MWQNNYAMNYPGGYPVMHHDYFFHPLITVVLAIIVLVILFRLLRSKRSRLWGHCGHGALETLRDRYAKGEIDAAEYQERKKVLES